MNGPIPPRNPGGAPEWAGNRFSLFVAAGLGMLAATAAAQEPGPPQQPNIVLIFADDLGYGDIEPFGHPTISTPHLDRMAAQGQVWTQFYVSSSVCTPSRAGLLTGRYAERTGVTSGVYFPQHEGEGLPADEITIAELLREQGYATGCFGKWHLGHSEGFLPVDQGFDEYYGLPYSNDMWMASDLTLAPDIVTREGHTRESLRELMDRDLPAIRDRSRNQVPLMRDTEVIEFPADQSTLTLRYTDEAVRFIEENQHEPFFLYLPHTFPHTPLHASEEQRGKSKRGLYGDVVEELDTSTGRILDTLEELDLAEDTLVIFTSDNGPWLARGAHGGSAGLLKGGKISEWEGGLRVPTLFWWPGQLEAGKTVRGLSSTLDLLPTIATLTGADVPDDRVLDGFDLTGLLFDGEPSPRELFFYYSPRKQLHAVRSGPFKAHLFTHGRAANPGPPQRQEHDPPLLYHLERDPSEQYEIGEQHPDVLERIQQAIEEHRATYEEETPITRNPGTN